jgi:D-xylose transport system substrate-binding protein
MSRSVRRSLAIAMALATTFGVVACGDDDGGDSGSSGSENGSGEEASIDISTEDFTVDFSAMEQLQPLVEQGEGKVAVLLPDTTTSARYETFDRPYLEQAFEAAGLSPDDLIIQNAQGSAATMQTQAEAAITEGASVLLIDALDSGSGAAIAANAVSKGLKVIDYDRLTKGGPEDRIYVSFDNVKVGELIGQGFVDCVADWGLQDPNVLVMAGDPTDNNATLFKEGYMSVLQPKFDDGSYVNAGEPAGTWDPDEAATTFTQALTADSSINSAVTPNDDNANAVIAQLQAKQIEPGTFPTTGQDASISGLQNILEGYQCGTVYKPIYLEAQAAAAVALFLRAGQTPPEGLVNGTTDDDGTAVQSVLLTPVWVTTENMADTVVSDEAVERDELCVTDVADACTEAGI